MTFRGLLCTMSDLFLCYFYRSEHLYILLVTIVEHWIILLYLFFVYRVDERKSNLFDVLLMSY